MQAGNGTGATRLWHRIAHHRLWTLPATAFPPPGRRPANLIYGVGDSVPPTTLFPLAVQHALLALTYLIYPLIAASTLGLADLEVERMMSASALGMGLCTIVQCAATRLGSGHLMIHVASPSAIPLAVQSMMIGGPAALGLSTLVVGVLLLTSSAGIRLMRTLFPPEVCGVAVLMLGVSLADAGLRRAFGLLGASPVVHEGAFLISLVTLFLTVGITLFMPRGVKIFAVLIGVAGGWALSEATGVSHSHMATEVAKVSLFALPGLSLPGFSLAPALIPLIVIQVAMMLLDLLSTSITLERMEDGGWRHANMRTAQRAVVASGIGNMLSGLAGGFATATSSSAIGLAFATGTTARIVGVCAGIALCAAAFFPKLLMALTLIPSPVIGGIVLYTAAFMLVTGMSLIVQRQLDERRIFMVGLSIVPGLAAAMFPLVHQVPAWAHPVFSTPLTVSATFAIVLNLLFRIGISRKATAQVPAGADTFEMAETFLTGAGRQWGLERDRVAAAVPVTALALDMLFHNGLAQGDVVLSVRVDPNALSVLASYDGEAVHPPEDRPDPESLLGTPAERVAVMAYLLGHLADDAQFTRLQNRRCIVLRFDL